MSIQLTTPSSLEITTEAYFNDMPIQFQHGPLVVNYLESSEKVLRRALQCHPRTLAVRVDLRFPPDAKKLDAAVISRFIASLRAQIVADLNAKKRAGKRVHECTLRFIWVREQDTSETPHYHVLLLFNADTYNCLGNFQAEQGNLAYRIRAAWASALGMRLSDTAGAVHFPANSIYLLNSSSPSYVDDFNNLFYRVSYFAKVATKSYGSQARHFAGSRV